MKKFYLVLISGLTLVFYNSLSQSATWEGALMETPAVASDQMNSKGGQDLAFLETRQQSALTSSKDLSAPSKSEVKLQEKVITGTVTSDTGEPIPGVTIIEVGTSNGVISDINGAYSIPVTGEDAVLQFSFVGMLTEQMEIQGQTVIDIVLLPDITQMDEVVVVGYGTARKADLTGAVGTVNVKEMQRVAATSVEAALQGRVAGVFVTQNNGTPGEAAKVYIRGPGTINNTDPLWVIDGIPSEAGNSLDMSVVESISILKDASAAAIYGSRAANGVILVTTKRGKSGELKVGFNTYLAQTQPTKMPDLVNAMEYAEMRTESLENAGRSTLPVYEKFANGDTALFFPDGSPIGEGTRWFEDVLFDKGSLQNYNFYVSGGSEKVNFYTSFDYFKEDGTALLAYFERYSFNINSDYKVGKMFTLGQSLQLAFTEKRDAEQIVGEQMARVSPFMPVWDETRNLPYPYDNFGIVDKDDYGFDPPSHFGMAHVEDKVERWYNTRGSAYIDFHPIKGLSWRTSLGGILKHKNERHYGKVYDMGNFYRYEDFLQNAIEYQSKVTFNSFLSYTRSIERHNFTAMVGAEFYKFSGSEMTARRDSFPVDLVIYDQGNPNKSLVEGKYNDNPETAQSFFGRLNYNFDNKYYFQFNFRRDGSSKFGPSNRYGNFPSFSAGWRITNESFMESIKAFMDLKLRGGWGIIGNSSLDAFRYLTSVNSSGNYYSFGGHGPDQSAVSGAYHNEFANEAVQWEETTTTNLGLDLGLFRSSLMINADFYDRTTRKALVPVDLPYSGGFYRFWNPGETWLNVGDIRNRGFEVSAAYNKKIAEFDLSVTGNFSYNTNKMLDLSSNDAIINGQWGQYYTEAGYPMSYYRGLEIERIYQATEADTALIYGLQGVEDPSKYYWHKSLAPGDFKFKDINGDSLINDDDMVMIGNPWPKYVFGMNISAAYKGFDLSMFFQGVAGKDIYNRQKRYTQTIIGDYCPTKEILDRWTPENPSNEIPRNNFADPNRNFSRSSTYFVESGSYLRLKLLQLGYSLPKSVLQTLRLSRFRIYVSGQNLFTITKYSGLDPEFSSNDNTSKDEDQGMYPQNKVFMIGLQVEF